MHIDWKNLTTKDIEELAENWFTEIDVNDCARREYRDIVEDLHTYTDDKFLWEFIFTAMVIAANDGDLEHLAAGPMYFFIERYGDDWIKIIEQTARSSSSFAKLLTGVWKCNLSESIWTRIEAIQTNVPDPLPW